MVNFRYHIVSLIATFLALAIGVVMGSAVIDKAVVETLEDQQNDIGARVDEVIAENDALSAALAEMQQRSQRLSDEASQLLAGSLDGVPVAVLAMRGVPSEQVDDLEALLASAGVDAQGTLWFTERLALADDEQRRDLARVVGRSETMEPSQLRDIVVDEVAQALLGSGGRDGDARAGGVSAGDEDGSESVVPSEGDAAAPGESVPDLVELREAGFVDFEGPGGDASAITDLATPGLRVVLVTGPGARLDPVQWLRPLAEALVGEPPRSPELPMLVVDVYTDGSSEEELGFTATLRADDTLSARLSTVSRIDDFAGQLATVLALQELGEGDVGHYGRDAQRLIPAADG